MAHIQQLVLVWSPGKGSPIHDHGNAHCLMKVLRGSLTETRYAWPEYQEGEGGSKRMTIISEKTYQENGVTYMADELGLHRVWNKGSDFAVSLHRKSWPYCLGTCLQPTDRIFSSVYASERGQGRVPHL